MVMSKYGTYSEITFAVNNTVGLHDTLLDLKSSQKSSHKCILSNYTLEMADTDMIIDTHSCVSSITHCNTFCGSVGVCFNRKF